MSFRKNSSRKRRQSLKLEPLEDRRMLATFTVTDLADTVDPNDGLLTLREAVDLFLWYINI